MKPSLKEILSMSSKDFVALVDDNLEAAAKDRDQAIRDIEAKQRRNLEALSSGKTPRSAEGYAAKVA